MKLLLILIGLVAAGLVGYQMEPRLRYQLTGMLPKTLGATTAVPVPAADTPQVVDPATLPADQLPAKVTLHSDVKVTDAAAEVTMTIPAGNHVKLVRIEGTNAVVSPGEGPYSGILPISETDLMEQLATSQATAVTPAPATPDPFADPAPIPATDPPATEPTTATEPVVVPDPAPATPSVVVPDPAPVTDPATASPDPVVVTQPAPAPAPATNGAVSVVQVMQASIRSGQIKEFTLDQVKQWKAEPDETVDGEVFAVGSCFYTAETIFGSKTIQAKALVKGGKVQRWIWPKRGTEIK